MGKGYFARGSNWKGFKDFDLVGWAKDAGGQVASWNFNHSLASKIYGKWDYEDPDSMARWSHAPLVGNVAGARSDEFKAQENERWKQEIADYYGVDPEDIAYPYRAGLVSGNIGVGGSAISDAVKNLYGNELRKWKL